jgi:hypothetical protein
MVLGYGFAKILLFLIAKTIGRVMPVETIKLSRIVMKLSPDLYPFLKRSELDSEIVLVHGIEALEADDVLEIVQFSISEHQKDAFLH